MNVQVNYPVEDRDILEFDEGGRESWYTIHNGPQIPIEEAQIPEEFNVSDWFNGAAPGSYRLLIIKNRTENPHLGFPMNKIDFEEMLRVQGFPCLNELSLAIWAGGHAVFEDKANDRRNFFIGGGVATYSIGAFISHDKNSTITTGCIILGGNIQCDEKSFGPTLNSDFNPLAIFVLIASILIDKLRTERRELVVTLTRVESLVVEITQELNREPGWEKQTQGHCRSLIIQLSQSARPLGRIQTMIERAKLIMKFVAETAEARPDPQISARLDERIKLLRSSLEYMSADEINLSARLTCQNTIATNLLAQLDVTLSLLVAEGSKAIADATRRDGAAMKVIAWIGAAFLPANVIAAFLSLIQLQWDVEKIIWVYFAITIPITILTLVGVAVFWHRFN